MTLSPARVSLVLGPTWTVERPPLGLASLAAHLRGLGSIVTLFDFNVELYQVLRRGPQLSLWSSDSFDLWNEYVLLPMLFPDELAEHVSPAVARYVELFGAHVPPWADRILTTDPHLVGFSVMATTTMSSLLLARELKRRSPALPIVFGGPSCFPGTNDRFFARTGFVDAVVTGEGEDALAALVGDVLARRKPQPHPGVVVPTPDGGFLDGGPCTPVADLDRFPDPDFEGLPRDLYLRGYRELPVMISRGCLGRCRFCIDKPFWGRFRARSGERVATELDRRIAAYGTREFLFCDLLFNGSTEQLRRMCSRLIETGCAAHWFGNARVRPLLDVPMLSLMAEAGCLTLCYGFEHGSDRILGLMRKDCTTQDYAQALRRAAEAGIAVSAGFVVGYPGETEEDFEAGLRFMRHNKSLIAEVHVAELAVIPGTDLYADAPAHGVELGTRISVPDRIGWAREYKPVFQSDWRAKDGSSTPEIRVDRLRRFKAFLKAENLLVTVHGKGNEENYAPGGP